MHRNVRLSALIIVAFLTGVAFVTVPVGARAAGQARARVATSRPVGATDMFLKIEGVDGESKASGHEKWIEVESFGWGGTNARARRSTPAGNGPGSLALVRYVDRASPKLSEACAAGRSLGRVVVHVRTSGNRYQEYVVDDVRVRSCSPGAAGDRQTENVTLNFGKVEASPDGDPDQPLVIGR